MSKHPAAHKNIVDLAERLNWLNVSERGAVSFTNKLTDSKDEISEGLAPGKTTNF